MKDVSEVNAIVIDYGSFIGLAERLAETYAKVLYYSPFEQEFHSLQRCVIGDGLQKVEREDEFLDPDILKTIDLAVFPDIGYRGLQKHLRDLGICVFGSMAGGDLELYRTRFLTTVAGLGLPVIHYVRKRGLTELSEHLKTVERKWIKINRYRDDMETWFHLDYTHSRNKLAEMAVTFGPLSDSIIFVVQDEIPDAIELGYDGWTIEGEFPGKSFYGYEKKNELYLGVEKKAEDLPESALAVNQAMAPLLRDIGYANFWATEIREVDSTPYFIDPTARLAGQTMEHQFETCKNLPEIIWAGANGELIEPEFTHTHAAEATLHHKGGDGWKTLQIPEEVRQWFKLYHYCENDGAFHFPPHKTDEVGVVIGAGNDVGEAIEDLKEHFAAVKDEPLEIRLDGFTALVEEIEKGEKAGVEFTEGALPDATEVLTDT